MNLPLWTLVVTTTIGSAVCKLILHDDIKTNSIDEAESSAVSYDINDNNESFPTQWAAEFNNPGLLMTLKPYFPDSSKRLDTWNVKIQFPKKWEIRPTFQSRIYGSMHANFKLHPTNDGTEDFHSQSGFIEPSSTSEALEVVPTSIQFLLINNVVTAVFSVQRQ